LLHVLAPPASKPVAAATAPPTPHRQSRRHAISIAHRNHVSVAELAKPTTSICRQAQPRMKLTVPGAKSATAVTQPACRAAGRSVRSRHQAGDVNAPPQTARLAQATVNVEEKPAAETPAVKPAKPPARCRPSAGRCAQR